MIAHINSKNEEQTVLEHNEAVAKLGSEKAKERSLMNVLFLTGLFHDLGKETEIFDDYIHKASADPKSVRRGEINHSSAGGKYIFERYGGNSSYRGLTAQLIATAIFSHHGLIDCLKIDGTDQFLQRVNPQKEIYYEESIRNSEAIFRKYPIDELFDEAEKEIKGAFQTLKKIADNVSGSIWEQYFLIGLLERLMLSILLDADRTDTGKFMKGLDLKEHNTEELQVLWRKFQKHLDVHMQQFTGTDDISRLRKQISAECLNFGNQESGIYCMSIPTGGGKTLCSLRFSLEHAIKKNKKRIIYIAPFLSILEQNAKVIRDILKEDSYILEHHSSIVYEKAGEKDSEELTVSQLLMETWQSPIIITTMVQFLNTLFSSKTGCIRRMHQLQDAVIIIDEIQSLPIKCIHMFNMAMNFLAYFCNSSIILCSATQPLLDDVERKILYSEPKYMVKDADILVHRFKRVDVTNCIKDGGYSTKELAEFAMEKFNQNALIILNTKSAVRKLYEELKNILPKDVCLIQLTTYMCAQHRSDVIEKLKERLENQKVICISTQLIEAGVDISFQCVIRSIAGLDSIMQAAGRCNRNGNNEGWLGQVYIVNYGEENLGSLEELKTAKEATQTMLREFRDFPQSFNNDLLSIEAMNRYYELYFWERKKQMDYPVSVGGKHIKLNRRMMLYELLSKNKTGEEAYQYLVNDGKMHSVPMKQAFREAGDLFEVIGSETIGLIVPYKGAKECICVLKECTDVGKIRAELKKLQRYTINVYRDDKVLENLFGKGAIDTSVLNGSVLILDEEFYQEEQGVSDSLKLQIF